MIRSAKLLTKGFKFSTIINIYIYIMKIKLSIKFKFDKTIQLDYNIWITECI